MKLKVLNSDSSGNGYILENEHTALIIEAGVRLKKVKEALDFRINKVEGCLVSHVHGDHAKYVQEYINAGIKVYSSIDVFEKYRGVNLIWNKKKKSLGSFQFQAFKVVHDVECFCFLIYHKEMGLTCFITDTHYVPYVFKGLNNMIIEANYDIGILDNNVLNGRLLPLVRDRVINSHMSLDTVKEMLKANDIRKVNNVVLIHLSNGNSNAKAFQQEITSLTGKRVHIASKGLGIDFNKEL